MTACESHGVEGVIGHRHLLGIIHWSRVVHQDEDGYDLGLATG